MRLLRRISWQTISASWRHVPIVEDHAGDGELPISRLPHFQAPRPSLFIADCADKCVRTDPERDGLITGHDALMYGAKRTRHSRSPNGNSVVGPPLGPAESADAQLTPGAP